MTANRNVIVFFSPRLLAPPQEVMEEIPFALAEAIDSIRRNVRGVVVGRVLPNAGVAHLKIPNGSLDALGKLLSDSSLGSYELDEETHKVTGW